TAVGKPALGAGGGKQALRRRQRRPPHPAQGHPQTRRVGHCLRGCRRNGPVPARLSALHRGRGHPGYARGLAANPRRARGRGYLPPFAGSKNLRDAESGVRIEFLMAGDYPGDSKSKPVAFPNPATASTTVEEIRLLDLPRLIEMKLASGLTNLLRLRDI